MKGRILLALLFVAFLALGISSLNDLQQEMHALPPQQKTAVYIASPPAALPDHSDMQADALPKVADAAGKTAAPPVHISRCVYHAPKLLQSYYLACYQAFHFSDCAG